MLPGRMLALWLLAAHTQSLTRDVTIQSRSAGNASILFTFAMSSGTAASMLRLQADLNHDGMVSAEEAAVALEGWLRVAFTDVTITGTSCRSQRTAPDLTGTVRGDPIRVAVLWECEPTPHASLFVGDRMDTRMSFLPASVSAAAVCRECAEQRRAAREAEWFYLPGAFFLLD